MEPQFVLVDGRHRGADEASAAINVDQRRLGTHEFLEPGWGLVVAISFFCSCPTDAVTPQASMPAASREEISEFHR